MTAAVIQFSIVALPPGNADLISIQLLALDLSRGEKDLLYPGRDFARNDEWADHHAENLAILHADGEPNWCFYPPLVPYLTIPFARLNPETWKVVWGFLQFGGIGLLIWLIYRILQNAGFQPNRVLIAALVLGSYPVARSIELGQTSLLLAVLIWGGVYFAQGKTQIVKPVLIGIASFTKPFLWLSAMPDLFRRRTEVVAGAILSAGILFTVSFWVVGVGAHVEYWNLLTALASSQTAYYGNQSLMAGFMRVFSGLPVMDYGFLPNATFAFFNRAVAVGVLVVAWLIQRRIRNADPVLSLGLWLSAALLALPISWEHHLVFVLPVVAFLWSRSLGGWPKSMLFAATVLLEVCWLPLYSEGGLGRMAASLPLIGNLLLVVVIAQVALSSIAVSEANPSS